jgi:CubicO group peptidase (beta-lactamase class C family)
MRRFLLALTLLAATPASTQTTLLGPTPQQRSLAAGYVALTTCSAMFTARRLGGSRTMDSIRQNELRGVYPELDALVQTTEANDDGTGFSAVWDRRMPPRLALFDSRTGGCTLQPVNAPELVHSGPNGETIHRRVFFPMPTPRYATWPVGDNPPISISPHRNLPQLDDTSRALAIVEETRASPFIRPAVQNGPIARAFAGGYGERANTTAVVVIERHSEIVGERYALGFGIDTPQRTWSVAKSIAATLVGAAVQRRQANVSAPARIPNWQRDGDPRRSITLDQLLRMASGLTSDSAGNRTDAIYFGGTTVDEQTPGWPLIAAPGSTFRYANNDSLLAIMAISPTFRRHPPRTFFDSVNMHATVAETDWRGNYILSSQVWATARDLARFGMLYLNNGEWQGRRILPENWRTFVTTPSGPQPTGAFGYGASFWLLNRSEGVPPDTFGAFGNRGQYVIIVPSRNVVIVRRGEDPAGTSFDIAAFTRDVLAALE